MDRRPAKFIGQSYISCNRYGFRFVNAKDKHLSRQIARDLKLIFKPIYKNYE